MLKLLETAKIKLSSVSDAFVASGVLMVRALIEDKIGLLARQMAASFVDLICELREGMSS